jgi:uroporphyrinogen decarboxylase
MRTNLVEYILSQKFRLAMPLGIYPALQLIGKSIPKALNDPLIQVDAVVELFQRYGATFLQSAMDLTIEAEAFGCQIEYPENGLPRVTGRLVKDKRDLSQLFAPKPGHKRTTVPLSTLRILKDRFQTKAVFVLGTISGPLTLALNLAGSSDPGEFLGGDGESARSLLEVATTFLRRYAFAMKMNGADGILIVESAAGELQPHDLGEYSTPYLRQIIAEVHSQDFSIIYHNSLAGLDHLSFILESGADIYHFGSPMNLRNALLMAGPDVVISGNLDPEDVLLKGSAEEVLAQTRDLLESTADSPNFVPSTGGDMFYETPLANLDAFHQAIREFNMRS